MNLTIQLTDDQAEKLAADILSLHAIGQDKTAPLPELPTALALPDPHPAIVGPIPHEAEGRNKMNVILFSDIRQQWEAAGWKDSLQVRPKAEEHEPEPATRREWLVSINRENGQPYPHNDLDDPKIWDVGVRVREVLPGDPTPEQVEALVREAEHAVRHCKARGIGFTTLNKALTPFRKP